MKNSRFLLGLIALFGMIFLWNCNDSDNDDDDDDLTTNTVDDFFTIEDVTMTSGDYNRQDNTSSITNLIYNETFLQGGVIPVRVQTSEPMAYFLIGLNDVSGFYNVMATEVATDQPNEYLIYLQINQNVTLEQLVVLITEYTSDNVGGQTREMTFNNHGNVSGVLQVSMAWDKANDVDLHLYEPGGEHIFYGHSNAASGAFLDVDSNASCDIDNINNENITYGDEATIYNGEYIVVVDVWSSCDVSELTNYGVTVTYQGEQIAVTQGENPFYGTLNPDDSMVEVMKFNITNGVEPPSDERWMNQKSINLSPHKK